MRAIRAIEQVSDREFNTESVRYLMLFTIRAILLHICTIRRRTSLSLHPIMRTDWHAAIHTPMDPYSISQYRVVEVQCSSRPHSSQSFQFSDSPNPLNASNSSNTAMLQPSKSIRWQIFHNPSNPHNTPNSSNPAVLQSSNLPVIQLGDGGMRVAIE